ncbi:MAG: hypothetical protein AAFX46_15690 [Cyanobacteria bacterium J06636_27]
MLRDLRCHAMQGFIFTQPLQSSDFEQMLISKQTLNI